MLLRNENDKEIVSRDKRDRRDYEQISNLATRMGLYRYNNTIFFIYLPVYVQFPILYKREGCLFCSYKSRTELRTLITITLFVLHNVSRGDSQIYGKVVVASKVPLPNYRPDLDDKRPQREVIYSA